MTFSVKVQLKDGTWKVFHGIPADSYREAERVAQRRAASWDKWQYSINDYAAKAYRSDAKSVWRKT